ncbi:MAG: bifunctional phosphopantothenoylcysteine decarboxylase/phosphopantothenate--cysteine ligase CoaBC [Anaerolineae bacterium]|nr:bifunctional phosphopantothenoylcysteine decarboxylase/phosphopantothenate--cysteine ligase CoaBC [Anaerolineae bacterium]
MNPLEGKRIALGVTGSIAAYKAAEIASKLTQAGSHVDVILTESAERFISPLTFSSVTGHKAYTDKDLWGGEGHVIHIGIGQNSDLLLIAPCSATTIARLAHGLGDNLLSVTALAAKCPIMIAPAMDGGMYAHAATQTNLRILKERGIDILGPASGHLASGQLGVGRMMEPNEIFDHVNFHFSRGNALAGKKVVVTAGGTQESIDPVRRITNRSSGKQGYAVAQAALNAGADVVLITAPTALQAPYGCQVVAVTTAQEMLEAVLQHQDSSHALIMAAAVADYRPTLSAEHKIKKHDNALSLTLEPTQDILLRVAEEKEKSGFPKYVIGFAAETQDLLTNAKKKLSEKRLDMIVGNDVTGKDAGFGVDTNRVSLLFSDGSQQNLALGSKLGVGETIIEHIISWS